MNDVATLVSRLNALQQKSIETYNATGHGLDGRDLDEFRSLISDIRGFGYKPRRRWVRNAFGRVTGGTWSASPVRKCDSRGKWVKDEHEKRHNNECTTRAIYFCLNHETPYWDIREEQNRRARDWYGQGRCYGWNTEWIWGGILRDNGFVKIAVCGRIRQGVLAERLEKVNTRVIVHTNRHLSAVYNGAVVDDWDSRGKIVLALYVKREFVDEVKEILGL